MHISPTNRKPGNLRTFSASAATCAGAGAAALEPGLWELRSRPELSGVPVLSAPRNSRVCLTPQDIAAGNIDLASIPTCKVIGGAWEGASLRLRFDCRALPAGFRIEGVVEPRQRSLTGSDLDDALLGARVDGIDNAQDVVAIHQKVLPEALAGPVGGGGCFGVTHGSNPWRMAPHVRKPLLQSRGGGAQRRRGNVPSQRK